MSEQGTHSVRRTLSEAVFYPHHEPREASRLFRDTRKRLIVELDTPCYVCGVRQSTLSDPARNVCRASAMELHHAVIEWALAGAVDLAKLRQQYAAVTDQASLEAWIDSEANSMVLCDMHHRFVEQGIHTLTYPIWLAQRYVRDDYILTRPHERSV